MSICWSKKYKDNYTQVNEINYSFCNTLKTASFLIPLKFFSFNYKINLFQKQKSPFFIQYRAVTNLVSTAFLLAFCK